MELPFDPVLARTARSQARDVKKTPYVELLGGRVQGVVSSGSDVNRVYVSWVEAGSLDFYCSTNNNRPCGGLRGGPCKHITQMLQQAALQYDLEHVVQYLKLPGDVSSYNARTLGTGLTGTERKEPAGAVFSRFLAYLRLLEQEAPEEPLPERVWFI